MGCCTRLNRFSHRATALLILPGARLLPSLKGSIDQVGNFFMSILAEIQNAKNVKNAAVVVADRGNIALIKNDRFGIEVFDLPGGGQDVIATKGGSQLILELGKVQKWHQKIEVPSSENQTEASLLETLQRDGWTLSLVPPFEAALQELGEEFSEDLPPLVRQEETMITCDLLTKRSLFAARLLSLAGMEVDGLEAVVASLKESGLKTTRLNLFLGQVSSFSGVRLNATPKVDNKTPGREGFRFYETAVVLTLAEYRQGLESALAEAQGYTGEAAHFAAAAVLASYSQYAAIATLLG